MSRVERGRWKLVSSTSTTWNRKPGLMKRSVSPAPAQRLAPPRAQRRRLETTHHGGPHRHHPAAARARPLDRARGRLRQQVALGVQAVLLDPLDGDRLEGAGADVERDRRRARRRALRARRASSAVRWSPAVGAATAPGAARVDRLIPVAVLGQSARAAGTAASARAPKRSSTSSTGAEKRSTQTPSSPRASTSASTASPMRRSTVPGESFFAGSRERAPPRRLVRRRGGAARLARRSGRAPPGAAPGGPGCRSPPADRRLEAVRAGPPWRGGAPDPRRRAPAAGRCPRSTGVRAMRSSGRR